MLFPHVPIGGSGGSPAPKDDFPGKAFGIAVQRQSVVHRDSEPNHFLARELAIAHASAVYRVNATGKYRAIFRTSLYPKLSNGPTT